MDGQERVTDQQGSGSGSQGSPPRDPDAADQNRNDNLESQMEGMYMDCWDGDENHADGSSSTGQNSSAELVDRVIGALEDIVIKPSFQSLYNAFLDTNYSKFKLDDPTINDDQNFDIFMHYSCTIGTFLENELKKRLWRNFDMEEFISKIRGRSDLMDNEIIEMIFTLMDYTKFNELITDYSTMKADHGKLDKLITSGITVTKIEPPPPGK